MLFENFQPYSVIRISVLSQEKSSDKAINILSGYSEGLECFSSVCRRAINEHMMLFECFIGFMKFLEAVFSTDFMQNNMTGF